MHEEIVWEQWQFNRYLTIVAPLTHDPGDRKKVLYISFGIVLGHPLLMVRTSEDSKPPALAIHAPGNRGRYHTGWLRIHFHSRLTRGLLKEEQSFAHATVTK